MARDYKGIGNQDLEDGRGLVLNPIAMAENTIGRQPENGGNGDGFTDGGPMYTLNATGVHGVAQPMPFKETADCLTSSYGTKWNGNASADNGSLFVHQPISFDMAQITSKVNGTRVEPGLPVSTLAKGSQMHVAQPVFFEPKSPDGVPRIYPMEGAAPKLNTMGGGHREPCVTHPSICLMDQGGRVMNVEHDMTGTLRRETHGHEPIVAVGTDLYNGAITGDVAATMSTHGSDSGGSGPTVMQQMAVRRLTPKECERLQGFPDNYTDIMPKGKPTPDGPRYKALGNSMAVPVMAWIGKRIQEVENL
jgi:hypothetical protein